MNNKLLGFLALIFFLVIVSGLLWLAVQTDNAVSVLLSFAAGLSMIFLPCTLPLAFIIVPLALRQSSGQAGQETKPGRGLGIALTFGLGLSVTLALYGIATAFLGDYFGLDQFTRAMFVVAGAMALIFALTELNLLRVPLPVFTHRIPAWTQGYGKSFLLGLFLGNAGIGCPNPAFYVLLTYIASTGSAATGGWLGLVHGLGRATPLIFLVILTLIGLKSIQWMSKVSGKIHISMGAGLVLAGAFILTYGLFGMHWWEDSIFHASWNRFVYNVAPNLAEVPGHPVAEGVFEASSAVGWWSLIILILIPFIWYKLKYGIRSGTFLVIVALLLALGFLASAGVLEVEHGHGVDIEKSSQIRLESPQPNEVIKSPLTIMGEARGNWFFEASFLVILTDWDGKIIAQHYAEAQPDPKTGEINWMTEEFVPFKATLEFKNPSWDASFSKRGTLILQKDNPSGLPEHDDALEIPVRFD